MKKELPLVYSCSGCSSAAQMANSLAVRLDRSGEGEMSCIAGVGGGVGPLVQVARWAKEQERPIVAIDGCPLHCVAACLGRHDMEPTLHFRLAEAGVRKIMHGDFDPHEFDSIYNRLLERISAVESSSGTQAACDEFDA